ncbi:MAG: mandelate racemase/muconate lactonizing enzyme family protein [Geminicoccaceae bacterium]
MAEQASAETSIEVRSLESWVLRKTLARPRRNAFGEQTSRAVLIIRIVDQDGVEGWGEAFCAWPFFAAEYRQRIITELLTPWIKGRRFASPDQVSREAAQAFHLLKIQSGDFGPFEHAIASLDIASWDLWARKLDKPLWQALGGKRGHGVQVYASGLSESNLDASVNLAKKLGITGFKLKVGFGTDNDRRTLDALVRATSDIDDRQLMVDANQSWSIADAKNMGRLLADYPLEWVEEPIVANSSSRAWSSVASALPCDIAAGENVRGSAWDQVLRTTSIKVLQPDVIKFGGLTAGRDIGRKAIASGRRFCPHFLGAGVGLLATAHLCAAADCADTLLEFDVTENPYQGIVGGPVVQAGRFQLPQGAGLGATPAPDVLAQFDSASSN